MSGSKGLRRQTNAVLSNAEPPNRIPERPGDRESPRMTENQVYERSSRYTRSSAGPLPPEVTGGGMPTRTGKGSFRKAR